MSEENKQTEVGALWKKEGRKGAFFGGNLDFSKMTKEQWEEFVKTKKLQVVVFNNEFKQNERHPDVRVYISKPKDAQAPTASAPAAKKKPVAAPAAKQEIPPADDGQVI